METIFLCDAVPKALSNCPCEPRQAVMTDQGVTRPPYSKEAMRIDVCLQNTVA